MRTGDRVATPCQRRWGKRAVVIAATRSGDRRASPRRLLAVGLALGAVAEWLLTLAAAGYAPR